MILQSSQHTFQEQQDDLFINIGGDDDDNMNGFEDLLKDWDSKSWAAARQIL